MSKKKPPAKRRPAAPKRPEGPPPWLPAVVLLGVVAIAVVVFIVTRPGPPKPPPRQVDVVAELAAIKPADLAATGKGSATSARFKAITEPALTAEGKPVMLYIGAEYCPYCAGERWAMIVALSRFGTFSGVKTLTSSEANLPTFTFHGSSYTSQYVDFVPVEAGDLQGNPLDKPTAAQSALEQKYATGIPFVDFANKVTFDGATYDVSVLQGLNWQQVLTALKQPGTGQAQGILGSANLMTAELCRLTGEQPGAVCSDPVIKGLQGQLPGS